MAPHSLILDEHEVLRSTTVRLIHQIATARSAALEKQIMRHLCKRIGTENFIISHVCDFNRALQTIIRFLLA